MSRNLRSGSDKSDELVNFLKSSEFSDIIQNIVRKEVNYLNQQISDLRSEIDNLKQTNIDLIRLLSNKGDRVEIKSNDKSQIATMSRPMQAKKPQTFAEKVKETEKHIISQNKTESRTFTLTTNNKTDDDERWKTVMKKKKNRKSNTVYGTVQNAALKGATQYSHFHVSGLEPDISVAGLTNYLKDKEIENIKCEKMQSNRPEEYSSFKLSVPAIYKDIITNPETWPLYVRVNPFLFRLMKHEDRK